jgi:hypothetical protein
VCLLLHSLLLLYYFVRLSKIHSAHRRQRHQPPIYLHHRVAQRSKKLPLKQSPMELDWGLSCFDGDEDFVQTYDIPEVDTVRTLDDPYESDDEIESSSFSKRKGTNNKRTRTSPRASKKKRKRKKTGTEHFYETVLRWSIPLLSSNDRRRLNLPPLLAQPTNYASPLQYYQHLQILPIEESRVSLVRGMEAPSNTFFMSISSDCASTIVFDSVTGLSTLDFELSSSHFDAVKPGWVYFLFPVSSDADGSPIAEETLASKRGISLRTQLAEDIDRSGKNSLMATLCLSSSSYQSYSTTSQSFWIHNVSLSRMDSCCRSSCGFPVRWKAYAIENLISYQRMVSSCHDSPKPLFLSGLLGHKLPVHVRFDADDDELGATVSGVGEKRAENSSSRRSDHQSTDSISSNDDSSCSSEDEECGERGKAPVGLLLPLDSSQQRAMDSIMGEAGSGLARAGALHMVQGPPGAHYA